MSRRETPPYFCLSALITQPVPFTPRLKSRLKPLPTEIVRDCPGERVHLPGLRIPLVSRGGGPPGEILTVASSSAASPRDPPGEAEAFAVASSSAPFSAFM